MKKKNKMELEISEEMLTVQDAAARKGVSDSRIYQWISEGRLTKHERYGRTLVNPSELDALTTLKRGRRPKSSD